MTAAAPRRRGRPSRSQVGQGPATRDRILEAARTEFAERGYEKASVRAIAKTAGVDSALVHHYFGTKEQVFEAAVEVAFVPALHASEVLTAGSVTDVGERLTRFFFGVWENPATRAPLLAIVRSALNYEAATAVVRRLVSAQLLSRIAGRIELPDARLRAELAAAQLVGAAILRYVIRVEPLASVPAEDVIVRIAPVVQGHLTGFATSPE
ncbi:TetR/AcrR family transcriptional regulator [Streptomyces odontomachi]|uniref:TetR/AcrR family transcriptional regulator n=1 Tax=Streptomyces odontomachi TaxID=2944940 RepID=UPI002109775E|nr:TetR family transcriptional regulator [Streptomyces sp. ODS25]